MFQLAMLLMPCGTSLLQVTRLSASVSLFHEMRFLYQQQSWSLWDAGEDRPVPRVASAFWVARTFLVSALAVPFRGKHLGPGQTGTVGTRSISQWLLDTVAAIWHATPLPHPTGGTRALPAAKASPAWPLTPSAFTDLLALLPPSPLIYVSGQQLLLGLTHTVDSS